MVAVAGFSRGSGLGIAQSPARWIELREAVRLSARDAAEPWQTADFEAWISTAGGAKRLNGMLVRTQPDDGSARGLEAYCSLCPHEICLVEYVRETKSVPMDAGPVPKHPLLVCSCHFSVFDPLQHGRAISGPAHRGMYTFELERSGDVIGIERVDAEILELLG